jgi:hypothetical protein
VTVSLTPPGTAATVTTLESDVGDDIVNGDQVVVDIADNNDQTCLSPTMMPSQPMCYVQPSPMQFISSI